MPENRRISLGFTLIELLVVIAVISVLMSILVPAIENARIQARRIICTTNMRAQQSAQFMYATENRGRFPKHDDTQPAHFRRGIEGSEYASVLAVAGEYRQGEWAYRSKVYDCMKIEYITDKRVMYCPMMEGAEKAAGRWNKDGNPNYATRVYNYYLAPSPDVFENDKGGYTYGYTQWHYVNEFIDNPEKVASSYNWYANFFPSRMKYKASDPDLVNNGFILEPGTTPWPSSIAECTESAAFIGHAIGTFSFSSSPGGARDWSNWGHSESGKHWDWFSNNAESYETIEDYLLDAPEDENPVCFADGHVEVRFNGELRPRACLFAGQPETRWSYHVYWY